jgi:hypothetical protein
MDAKKKNQHKDKHKGRSCARIQAYVLLPGALEVVPASKSTGQDSTFVAQGPVRIAAASFQSAQEGFARCEGNLSSGNAAALTRQAAALCSRCALHACLFDLALIIHCMHVVKSGDLISWR